MSRSHAGLCVGPYRPSPLARPVGSSPHHLGGSLGETAEEDNVGQALRWTTPNGRGASGRGEDLRDQHPRPQHTAQRLHLTTPTTTSHDATPYPSTTLSWPPHNPITAALTTSDVRNLSASASLRP